LLYKASIEYEYALNLDLIAKIWRGGCIIRAAFLEDIYTAFNNDPKLQHIFLDASIRDSLSKSVGGIRRVVSDATRHGISVPAFSAALSYFDAFRSENMPANLIQAQRDYFGSHTYELRGKEGIFHTEWTKKDH
jgi:6-phosphogluconate dehydrogenase